MKRIVHLLLLGAPLLISACASAPVADPPPSEEAEAEAAVSEQPLPNRELDPELLYDLLLSDIALYRGDINTAVASAIEAAEESGDYRLARKATTLAMRTRRYEDAIRVAKLWDTLEPDTLDPEYAIIIAEVATGKVDSVTERLIEFIQAHDGGVDEAVRVITSLLGQQSNGQAALEVIEALSDEYPDNAQLSLSLAYIARNGGEADKVNVALDRALALRPGWESAALMKTEQLDDGKDFAPVETFILEFLDSYPKATKLRTRYSQLLARQERLEDAWDQIVAATSRDSDDVTALYFAGTLGAQLEKMEAAEDYFKQVLEIDQDNDDARIYLARIAQHADQHEAALDWYRQVIDPRLRLDAQLQTALILRETEGVTEGLRYLDRVEYSSEDGYVKFVLARHEMLMADRQLDTAFGYINEALHEVPGHDDLLYSRALVAAELDYLDVVETDLRMLLDRDPSNAHALNALGYTLADRTDRYDEAMELISRALELRPDDPYIIDSMGWLHYRLGNHDESLKHLRDAYLVRQDVEIAAHLGEVLWKTGNPDEANAIWDEALEAQPDNPILIETLERLRP